MKNMIQNWKANCHFYIFLAICYIIAGSIHAHPGSGQEDAFRWGKCTSLMVGRNATVDGSVISTQSQDSGNCGISLRLVPSAAYAPGAVRIVQLWNAFDMLDVNKSPAVRSGPTLTIPQAARTHAYVEAAFPFMNEYQVAIGESTLGGARPELTPTENSDAKLRITDVSRIALERATTAREAIRIMSSLMEEHGWNPWLPGIGEFFAVSDKNEVWAFEFVPVGPNWKKKSGEPGVCWVAMRIPDEGFAVNANESIIGEIDITDKDRFMASSNVMSLAIRHGWWNPKSGTPFRWDLAYFGKKADSLRTWRALSLIAPSLDLKPHADEYPNYVIPDNKLSILDIRAIHGDHFEGTEFDKTKGLAGGPFGSPEWPPGTPNNHRSISILHSDTVIINQSRRWLPDPIGGVMWVGFGGGDVNVYVPLYAGILRIPGALATGIRTKFSWDSAFWVFYLVGNWAQLNYVHMIGEIKKVQASIENEQLNRQDAVDEDAFALYQNDPQEASEFLTRYCSENAARVLDRWKELASYLIAKYGPGSKFAPLQAPEWWRKAIVEKH